MIHIIRAVSDYNNIGLKPAVGKGRSVIIRAADALNYAVVIKRERRAVSIGKRVNARIPALRDAVADEERLFVKLMTHGIGTVGKLYVIDHSNFVRWEAESDAAGRGKIDLGTSVRYRHGALISSVDKVLKSSAALDPEGKVLAVGLKIEPDAGRGLRAEAENFGERIERLDLAFFHFIKVYTVRRLIDLNRADGQLFDLFKIQDHITPHLPVAGRTQGQVFSLT